MPMTNPYVRKTGDLITSASNALAGAVTTGTSILDERLKEQAVLDVKRMNLELSEDTDGFLLELQQGKHGGIENWEQATKDFLQSRRPTSDKDSKFYCRNAYTAKLYDESFGQTSVDIKNRVAVQVWNMHVGEERSKVSQSLNQIRNSALQEQEKIDMSADMIDQSQRAGIYSKPEADSLKSQVYTQSFIDDNVQEYKKLYEQGKTPSQIKDLLEARKSPLSMQGEEYEGKIDRKSLVDKASQAALQEIRQVQKENDDRLIGENTVIMNKLNNGDPQGYVEAIRQQKKIRGMNSISIDPASQRQRDFELNGAIKIYNDGRSVTSSKGKAAVDGEKNFNAVASQIKNGQKQGLKEILNQKDGYDGTIYSIKNAYLQPYLNRINTIAQTMRGLGIPEEQITQEYADTVGVAMGGLIDAACDAGLFPTELKKDVSGVLAEIKAKEKEIARKNPGDAANYASEAMEFIWDTVCGANIKKVSADTISKAYADFEQAQNAKTYDRLVYGNKHDDGEWGESDLLKALNQQKNDALVWTDKYGNKHAPEGVEKGIWLGRSASVCRSDLAQTLSTEDSQVTDADIIQVWELNDEGTDVNSRLNYLVGDKMYRYVTDEKGKNIRLEAKEYGQKWSEAQEIPREKIKKSGVFDKLKEAFTQTEEQKQASAAREEARRRTFEAEQEFRRNMPEEFESLTAKMAETNRVPENFAGTEEMWDNLSDNEKEGYYTQYLSGAYDSLEGYQGIDKYRARYDKFMGGKK